MIREIPFGSDLYAKAVAFRDATLRQPLGRRITPSDVAGEDTQIHIAALDGDAVRGTIILKTVSPTLAKARQMAIASGARGAGLGAALLRFAEAVALASGATEIELNARQSARGFYKKQGYTAIGDTFTEIDLPHIKMTKRL